MRASVRGLLCLAFALAACEDAPRPASPAVGSGEGAAPAAQPTPSQERRPSAAPTQPEGEASAAVAEHDLTETDFVESLQNRDPFRSYLADILGPKTAASEWEVLLKKYPLDELKLIAIVSGGTAPRAMFEDPGGTGVTVKRGDRLSKSEGKITKILSDRVIIEIEDAQADKDKPEVLRREVLLHPEEPGQ